MNLQIHKGCLFFLAVFLFSTPGYYNDLLASDTTTIYLFPGQGADHRLFNNIAFPSNYDTVHICLPTPYNGETLHDYAGRFIPLIDTTNEYFLLGVSLGGMICTELSEMINAENVIIISSAKCSNELPSRYTFQKKLKLNRIVTGKATKRGALFLQPIVEPVSKNDKELFTSMLSAKDPDYIKRTVDMIINWERANVPSGIIHIHGTKDKTIPVKHVNADYYIEGGSHMMVYTLANEITPILNEILKQAHPSD